MAATARWVRRGPTRRPWLHTSERTVDVRRGGHPRDTRATARRRAWQRLLVCWARFVAECFLPLGPQGISAMEWYSSTLAMRGIPGAEYSRTRAPYARTYGDPIRHVFFAGTLKIAGVRGVWFVFFGLDS